MTDKAILHEKDLVSCLVKILDPETDGIIGTGFFCHPEGYILTCYHVITSYRKKRHNEVLLLYKETRLNAQICDKYCSKEADIAILKVTVSYATPFYAPLDVHDRWTINDHIWSYGYPKGNFMEPGIGVTGSISGTTRIDGVEVIQINDLSIQIVGHGYSGAPVFHHSLSYHFFLLIWLIIIRKNDKKKMAAQEDLNIAVNKMMIASTMYFKHLWGTELNESERNLLVFLIKEKKLLQNHKKTINSLIMKEILFDRDGKYLFYVPVFKEWIVKQYFIDSPQEYGV